MSLISVLKPFNDPALESLASKGLVRRARKEVDKGAVVIESTVEDKASISTNGQTVSIDIKGPASAVCTCPATGTCRHILAAVMVLRESSSANTTNTANTESTDSNIENKDAKEVSALDELLALSNQEVLKFASTDAAKAVSLASNPEQFSIQSEDLNFTVKMLDSPILVNFIAGQGLRGALYKGPKTRSRLMIASSAILIRAQHGTAIKESDWQGKQKEKPMTRAFLESILTLLEETVSAVLSGSPDLVVDRLFDVSISMRTQAAPRVSAQLRALSKSARLAISRNVNFSEEDFLKQLSRTHALIIALMHSPSDTTYTGTLKRNYKTRNEMQLYILGAKHWQTPSGAKGITSYAYNPNEQAWYTLTNARAAGMDMGFIPRYAYDEAFWFGQSMQQLMASNMTIKGIRASEDNACAKTLADDASYHKKSLKMQDLLLSDTIINDWQTLHKKLSKRLGSGLKRATAPLPVLIKPNAFGELSFDAFNQCYRWEVLDSNKQTINIIFAPEKDELVNQLVNQKKRIKALLLEAYFQDGELSFEAINMMSIEKQKLIISNFQFEELDEDTLLERAIGKLREKTPQFKAPITEINDPLSSLIEAIINQLCKIANSPRQTVDLKKLINQCEEAGLLLMAEGLTQLQDSSSAKNLLKSLYLIFEIQALEKY